MEFSGFISSTSPEQMQAACQSFDLVLDTIPTEHASWLGRSQSVETPWECSRGCLRIIVCGPVQVEGNCFHILQFPFSYQRRID